MSGLTKLDFVRATYWIGAFVDIGAAVQLLLPAGTTLLGFPGLRVPGAAGQPAIMAAALMLAWAVLLIWAHLRTRERRGALAITLALVLGLAAGNLVLGASGTVAWGQLAPTLAIQAMLVALFGSAFAIARAAAIERGVA
jgi:hypothetical protein